MQLTPPPDHSKTYLGLAIGAGLALVIYTYSRSTLPHVGDNLHHLPHGGCYQDGTKSIFYGQPHKLNSLERPTQLLQQPWAYVIILGAIIFLLNIWESRTCRCGRCVR
ncbi:triple gene block protein 2 [Atractylodes mottle virus]|uniref:Movement protein TGB2 n=1 Tax=Atractylodes mottle virus TaxID=1702121 RepID=A0A0K2BN56_9VIRU|nr:triple gene block protein 2 [Atractylodes mottle virus]AKZ66616.1 triple gene block protein 2 [Atractylodes mottle virus]